MKAHTIFMTENECKIRNIIKNWLLKIYRNSQTVQTGSLNSNDEF